MKKRTAINREPSADAQAESERRAWAVGEMLGESEKRFPGLARAVLPPGVGEEVGRVRERAIGGESMITDCLVLHFNPLASEDECPACCAVNPPPPAEVVELCPYHKGERAGMEYLGRGLALWCANDFSGDPLDLAWRDQQKRVKEPRGAG